MCSPRFSAWLRALPATVLLSGFLSPLIAADGFTVKPDRAEGIYRAGETVRWTITWEGEGAPAGDAEFVAKRGGATVLTSGPLAFEGNVARVETALAEPDTLLLEVAWTDGAERRTALGGAVASPERIQPALAAPEDFDAFWAEKLAELAAVPANPQLQADTSGRDGVDYWRLTMDNIRGTRVQGQLARPTGDRGALPALLIVQWAGVYGLEKPWATDRAAEGWLTLNILAHDLPINETPEFYQAQRDGALKDYWTIGNDHRDTSYFLRMYLACYRAVEYLKSRPDWDGRTLVVMGTSQGGQQALVTGGLHPDITAVLALVPSGNDMHAPAAGRAWAFPNWYVSVDGKDAAAVREAGRYYDAAAFAARIKAPLLLGVGLQDEVCPPAGIFAAANQVRGYKEVVVLADSGHQDVNGSQQPYNRRAYGGWLPALRAGLTAPVARTTEEEHRRLLDELGIAALRPGANPNDLTSPHAANTDEARAHPYPDIPDALTTAAGAPVRTPEQWRSVRRPEILAHFEREIYGRVPAEVPAVRWEVVATEQGRRGDVAVVTTRLAGRVDNAAYPFLEVTLDLTLTTPVDATGPVPVMLHFGWPASVLARFPAPPGPTWEEQVLAHGWGAATLVPTSFQADNGAGLNQGIIGLTNRGQPRAPDQWGALRAWAWGASRALDYFETNPAVDARRVGIEGLSRYGKAAAVAMAFDERFAVGFIGSPGQGGLALMRRNFGERVENIASGYAFHWMAGNYVRYAGPLTPADLPVDAHQLLALCAPRPVFVSVGAPEVEGQWIDQRGTFKAVVAAGPVYALHGLRDLGTTEYPGTGPALVAGELAWRQHEGGHTTLPNWPAFLSWADRYLR